MNQTKGLCALNYQRKIRPVFLITQKPILVLKTKASYKFILHDVSELYYKWFYYK